MSDRFTAVSLAALAFALGAAPGALLAHHSPDTPWAAHAEPAATGPLQPAQARSARRAQYGDLSRFNSSIVRVETRAVEGARTAPTLGQRRSGTGMILDSETVLTIGYLLLEAEDVVLVTKGGGRIPAVVEATDAAGSGLGLVKALVPLKGKAIELGDSDQLGERQPVLTIGQGEPEATEIMVVSRKPFDGDWEYLLERGIFTFPPVNNWSGAALIDAQGRLVGVGSLMVRDAAAEPRDVPGNLYVPVNLVKPALQSLRATGRPDGAAAPWLGLITEEVRGHVMVTRVAEEGPAFAAGIRPGDLVVGVGDAAVKGRADFYRRVRAAGPAGTPVELRVLKEGALRQIEVRSVDREERLRQPAGI